jgi:hypothetical protein
MGDESQAHLWLRWPVAVLWIKDVMLPHPSSWAPASCWWLRGGLRPRAQNSRAAAFPSPVHIWIITSMSPTESFLIGIVISCSHPSSRGRGRTSTPPWPPALKVWGGVTPTHVQTVNTHALRPSRIGRETDAPPMSAWLLVTLGSGSILLIKYQHSIWRMQELCTCASRVLITWFSCSPSVNTA